MKSTQETIKIEGLEMYNPLIGRKGRCDLEIEKDFHKSFHPGDFGVGFYEAPSAKAGIVTDAFRRTIQKEGRPVRYKSSEWRHNHFGDFIPLSLPLVYSLSKKYFEDMSLREAIGGVFIDKSIFHIPAFGTEVCEWRISHAFPNGVSYDVRSIPFRISNPEFYGYTFEEVKNAKSILGDGREVLSALFLEDSVDERCLESLIGGKLNVLLPSQCVDFPLYPVITLRAFDNEDKKRVLKFVESGERDLCYLCKINLRVGDKYG